MADVVLYPRQLRNPMTGEVERVVDAAAHEKLWRGDKEWPLPEHLIGTPDDPQYKPPAPPVDKDGNRTDGPTVEEYMAAGYPPESYPPAGFAEKASPGLAHIRRLIATARAATAQPKPDANQGKDPEMEKAREALAEKSTDKPKESKK